MKIYIKSSGTFDPMVGYVYEFDELSVSAQDNCLNLYMQFLNNNGFDISANKARELLSTSDCTFNEDGTPHEYTKYPDPDDIESEKQKQEYNEAHNILDIFGYDFSPTSHFMYENNHLYCINNFGEKTFEVKCVKSISGYKIYSSYFDVALPQNDLYIVNTNSKTVWRCNNIIFRHFGSMRDLFNEIAEWLETNNPE